MQRGILPLQPAPILNINIIFNIITYTLVYIIIFIIINVIFFFIFSISSIIKHFFKQMNLFFQNFCSNLSIFILAEIFSITTYLLPSQYFLVCLESFTKSDGGDFPWRSQITHDLIVSPLDASTHRHCLCKFPIKTNFWTLLWIIDSL